MWDLSDMFTSFDEIDAHMKKVERAFSAFEKKYTKSDDWLTNQAKLAEAIEAYEKLDELAPGKAIFYLSLRTDMNSADEEAEAKLNIVSQQYSELANKLVFFTVRLSKLPKKVQRTYLASKTLKPYRYFLSTIFRSSEYTLDEAREQVLNLMRLPAKHLWVQGVQKQVSDLEVPFGKKKLPIAEALNKISDLPTLQRRKLWSECMKALSGVSDFAERELNAVITHKKITDSMRGYEKPYSATVIGYENEEQTVETLVSEVTKGFKVSNKFYDLKKELLGLEVMTYADRSAGIGRLGKSFDIATSYALLSEALQSFDPQTRLVLDDMLTRGRIDIHPRKGKRGGAYHNGGVNLPSVVLLNHSDTFNSLSTFAHEMGHAIHTEFSKTQRPLYQGYTISAAETASTFFEEILFWDVFEKLDERDKVIALHERLNGEMATVFRQIACFNLERELHETIREEGFMSKEKIGEALNKHMSAYLGKSVDMHPEDGNFFVNWPHLRYFFYVYAYAFGALISRTLYARYKEDPSYKDKIIEFLEAGGSDSPENIFAGIGIDVRDPNFFKEGIKEINKDINLLKRLAKKQKMID